MVGIGPGGALDRTHRAELAISQSSVIVGYTPYLELIKDLTAGKELLGTGMTQEIDRTKTALLRARDGEIVSLVSSGDSGIYGMAGLAIELAASEGNKVAIEIIPGVSAANAAAAKLGAPLMCDFATMSMSDLLVPWEMIQKRLEAVASADFVVAIYNPRSKKRVKQLEEAAAIFMKHRLGTTPVGIATNIGSDDERIEISDLEHFLELDITMRSIVVIGNSSSKYIAEWFITPRGYSV